MGQSLDTVLVGQRRPDERDELQRLAAQQLDLLFRQAGQIGRLLDQVRKRLGRRLVESSVFLKALRWRSLRIADRILWRLFGGSGLIVLAAVPTAAVSPVVSKDADGELRLARVGVVRQRADAAALDAPGAIRAVGPGGEVRLRQRLIRRGVENRYEDENSRKAVELRDRLTTRKT